jgi:hypothetical protein
LDLSFARRSVAAIDDEPPYHPQDGIRQEGDVTMRLLRDLGRRRLRTALTILGITIGI